MARHTYRAKASYNGLETVVEVELAYDIEAFNYTLKLRDLLIKDDDVVFDSPIPSSDPSSKRYGSFSELLAILKEDFGITLPEEMVSELSVDMAGANDDLEDWGIEEGAGKLLTELRKHRPASLSDGVTSLSFQTGFLAEALKAKKSHCDLPTPRPGLPDF